MVTRQFTLFGRGRAFSFSADNVLDCVLSTCTTLIEKAVLILGPLLIAFASVIISGLSWTFFTILVPMMKQDYEHYPFGNLIMVAHVSFVLFLLTEIVFNYFMCVMTRNKGPSYDKVVRELAEVTGFDYPETPQDVQRFRRDINDIMMLRMRRRQARDEQLQQQLQEAEEGQAESPDNNNSLTLDSPTKSDQNLVTQRKTKTTNGSPNKTKTSAKQSPSPQVIRSWMIMAPDEWGFCTRSNQPKPPRSHYDHVTKTLVLCLDHYCPWMFNAVGYFNYRYFCNFLAYVEIAMIYGASMAYRPFVNSSSPQYRKQVLEFRKTGVWKHLYAYTPINTERMPISLAFMLCLAVGIAVACLGGFHLYLVVTGQTTIEFHGNWVNKTKAKRLGQKWRNPYDLGWKRNVQQVYGTQPFLWAFLIPSTREPDFLPLPLLGEDGKRKHLRKKRDKLQLHSGDSEQTVPLTSSSNNDGDIV
ncbi:DHHC palmitoyltransferase [Nitzschia inconspicua]|uniref:Palmitoyltransferase n=1 Tax=Nitzschia inconspicua TaxID=303405 RepID=A0A9K3KCZ9_9STRA|nr:DHHC palmitoyltransferase [Nitzschia inconspicua]